MFDRQYGSRILEKKDKAIRRKRRAREKTRIRRNNKVKVGDDFSSSRNADFELVSKFFKNASEDILLEIVLRLPNYRSVILFGSVCRSWHFVISQPHFIPSFIRHHDNHQDRYILPCTIIFCSSDRYMFRGVQCHQPICKLFSEDSMFLHENASSSFLNFMPLPMVVRASFDDLLLVSPGSRCVRDYYICNPITKQWFQLPKMPIKLEIAGFALVCMLDDFSNKQQLGPQFKYKVVLFQSPFPDIGVDEDNVKICADIFCSKSGCWSRSFFYYPRPKEFKFKDYIGIVIYKGILHWLENEFISAGIIALDLFNGPPRCSVIDFLDDFGQNSCGQIHLGAVGGEVRLLHVFKMTAEEECYFVMKVWELKYDKDNSTSWVLIHEINLKRESGVNDTEEMVSMLAVHPNNGDVVFMIWGKHLFQYKITQDKYEKVDELQEPLHPFERVVSTPLVHLAWPTPVPSHPPSI